MSEPRQPLQESTSETGAMELPERVYTGRPPANMAPKSTYHLPASDRALAERARDLLRVHPMAYTIERETFNRCPTCEQWTGGGGCDVRKAVTEGDVEAARKLHDEREWPAGTGKKSTRFRGMVADYKLVTFEYHDG